MASLPFIEELTEARLFQAAKDVKGMKAASIAEIVYLCIMMMEVWRRNKPSEASSYAQNTLRYNPYDTMHYSATDLANLLSVLNHQDVFAGTIKVDKNISLPVFMINRYLSAVASNSTSSHSDDQTFFWRLEDYLKVYSNSAFRQMRRDIGNWTELSFADKNRIVQIVRREFDSRASSVDLYQTFRQSFRLKESVGSMRVTDRLEFTEQGDWNQRVFFEATLKDEHKNWIEKASGNVEVASSTVDLSPNTGIATVNRIDASGSKGYGSEMLAHIMKTSASHGYKKVVAYVENGNAESKGMFYSAGFKVVDSGPDGIYLGKDLATAPLGEAIDLKLAYNDTLNPALWENGELKSDVKDALGRIANKFAEFLDVNQIKIVDYVITGSNCAFNYTSQSDIDLHVMVDTSKLENNPLVDPFLQAKKSLWNSGHDITVKGYTVELYAEDVDDEDHHPVATGIYSLLKDDWLKKPTHEKITIDDAAVQAKVESIIGQINSMLEDATSEGIDELRDHLRKMRRGGLEKGGEWSIENMCFKALRNNGYLDLLSYIRTDIKNQELSLENKIC